MDDFWDKYRAKNTKFNTKQFENDCLLLLTEMSPDEKPWVGREKVGDKGIDIGIGELTGELSCYQCKYFRADTIGNSQKDQIRKSFNKAIKCWKIPMKKWVLLTSSSFDESSRKWWEGWCKRNKKKFNIEIEMYDSGPLASKFIRYNLEEKVLIDFRERAERTGLAKVNNNIERLATSFGIDLTPSSNENPLSRFLSNLSQQIGSDSQPISNLNRARLHLLSGSLLFETSPNENPFDSRQMNLFYSYRQDIEPVGVEKSALLKAGLSDSYSVIPFWFWFRGLSEDMWVRGIFSVLIRSEDSYTITNSFQLLYKIDKELALKLLHIKIKYITELKEIESIIDFLKETDNLEELNLLFEDLVIGDNKLIFEYLESRLHPERTIDKILLNKKLPRFFSDNLLSPSFLCDEDLLSLIDEVKEKRALLVKEMLSRTTLSLNDYRSKLTENANVRSNISILAEVNLHHPGQFLLESNKKYLETKNGVFGGYSEYWRAEEMNLLNDLKYKHLSLSELITRITLFGDGDIAYQEYLSRDFENQVSNVIRNLTDGFESFELELLDKTTEGFSDEKKAEFVRGIDEDLRLFIRDKYIKVAIKTLIEKNSNIACLEVFELLREGLKYTSAVAINYIVKCGNRRLLIELLGMVRDGDHVLSKDNILSLLDRSCHENLGLHSELISISNDDITAVVLENLNDSFSPWNRSKILEFLRSEEVSIREGAVSYVCARYTKEEIEELVENYNEGYYYFKVVSAFDKYLYKPDIFS